MAEILFVGASLLVLIAVTTVLYHHWNEFHGGNKY